MEFAFEDLQVYQRPLDFSVAIIEVIEEVDTPMKHYRLVVSNCSNKRSDRTFLY